MTHPEPDQQRPTPPQPANSGATDGQMLKSGAMTGDQEFAWLDDIILDLVHQGGLIERGKTINADMFPEAKAAIQSHIQQEIQSAMLRQKAYDERQLHQAHEAEVLEARQDQIMQDFLSLHLYDLTDFYENDLIEWREEQLAHLKQQQQERGTGDGEGQV